MSVLMSLDLLKLYKTEVRESKESRMLAGGSSLTSGLLSFVNWTWHSSTPRRISVDKIRE